MKQNCDKPIEHKILRYEIKKILTDAILNGEMAPGDRIIETRIAKELNVSQAPVREAIRELEQMGLVETQPHRGAFVKIIEKKEVIEAYKLRCLLEGYAAQIVAREKSNEVIDAFAQLIEKMKKSAEEGNRTKFIEMDIAFHELIIKSTGSSLLHRVWSLINMAHLPYLTFVKSTMTFEALIHQHEKILTAFSNKDTEGSKIAVQNHIEELASKLIENI